MPTDVIRPFSGVKVVPNYGTTSAHLTWNVPQDLRDGTFVVMKSPDGINGWDEIGKGVGIIEFEDKELFTRGRLDNKFFKVILLHNGERYDSDVVSTFGKLTRRQFAGARKIMHLEWQQLRTHQAVKLFKIDRRERCTECVDPDTHQRVGTTKCETCYGTGYKGGYHQGVDTFMRQLAISGDKQTNRPDGTGTSDSRISMVRMPAFPRLEQNDMIVYLDADKRWIVDSTNVAYFNAVAPVTIDASVQLLTRSDVRYKFPVQ